MRVRVFLYRSVVLRCPRGTVVRTVVNQSWFRCWLFSRFAPQAARRFVFLLFFVFVFVSSRVCLPPFLVAPIACQESGHCPRHLLANGADRERV